MRIVTSSDVLPDRGAVTVAQPASPRKNRQVRRHIFSEPVARRAASQSQKEDRTMKTPKMLAAVLGTLFVTLVTAGATDVLAATERDVQSPRAQVSAKVDDAQSPRGQDAQAPATTDDAQSPRSAR
jgi:hypothetical protein